MLYSQLQNEFMHAQSLDCIMNGWTHQSHRVATERCKYLIVPLKQLN